MSILRHVDNRLAVFGLAVFLVVPSFLLAGEQPQTAPKSSDELLLEIMEIHSQLVTNEVFLAQAKAIGAYLEAALQFDEPKKVRAYSTVLGIISQIKNPARPPATQPQESKERAEAKPSQPEPADSKIVYEPGSAILEIFNADSIDKVRDVIDKVQDTSAIKTYWPRGLAYRGDFPLPGRETEVGFDARHVRAHSPRSGDRDPYPSRYVAKFAFYYHAAHEGKYGFTVIHSALNDCVLKVGGVDVVTAQSGTTGQGACSLEEGFHRIEFWLVAPAPTGSLSYRRARDEGFADFQVKVMTPDGFDALPLTKDMMLLRADQKKAPNDGRPRKVTSQGIPYIDY